MKRANAIIVAVVAMGCGCFTATADWQYTRWGMSIQEVVTATSGVAKKEEGYPVKLTAPYKGGDFDFQASFVFNDSEKLQQVRLTLLDKSSCSTLLDSMSKTYGPPADQTSGPLLRDYTWFDEKNGNVVVYMLIYKVGCDITYEGRPTAGSGGGL